MRATFGALAPDQPDLMNGNLEDAVNCIPFEASYGPFPGPAVYSATVSGTVVGAQSTKSIGGTAYTFMGTAGALWKESAGAVNNVSRTASYAAAEKWEFATFGNTFLGVDGEAALQVWTLDTSTRFLDASASSSAPVAYHIATVRDFVWLGRQPTFQNRVQWCSINNPLRWPVGNATAVSTQADYQDLPGSSTVRKITGGDFATIVTEESIWRGSYVGSPLIFRFDELCPGVGTTVSGLVARFQGTTFLNSGRGFIAFDGQEAIPIGQGSIDEFFKDDFESGSALACSSVIDPVNKLYIAYYPSVSGSGRLIMYNFAVQKWARAEINLDFIFSALSGGYTLEGLDAVMPNIDLATISLDSDAWKGGLKSLAGFDAMHRLIKFDSSALTARFITGEAQLVEDSRAFIRAIRPLVEGSIATAITASIGGRDRLIDTVTYSNTVSLNSIGICPFRANNRYQRLKMEVAGGFIRAYGADVDAVPSGLR